jgi:uncharacterized protein with GYD domain
MAVYVTLYRYTDEGMKGIKDAPQIAQGWQQEAQKRGIKVVALYWLQGSADALTIVESDDDAAVNGLLLAIGAQGKMRTETMRGISPEDLGRAIQQIGG